MALLSDKELCRITAQHQFHLLPQGLLNRTYAGTAHPRRVLRFRRHDQVSYVLDYWRRMLGDRLASHLTFKRLDTDAEARRYALWGSLGVVVPSAVYAGKGWISYDFVDGTPLDRATLEQRVAAFPIVFAALTRLHEAGETAIDRGHGNEILLSDGSVVFVDAELLCSGPVGLTRAVDIVTMLRGWLRLSACPSRTADRLRVTVRQALAQDIYGNLPFGLVCEALDAWYANAPGHDSQFESQVSVALTTLLTSSRSATIERS